MQNQVKITEFHGALVPHLHRNVMIWILLGILASSPMFYCLKRTVGHAKDRSATYPHTGPHIASEFVCMGGDAIREGGSARCLKLGSHDLYNQATGYPHEGRQPS